MMDSSNSLVNWFFAKHEEYTKNNVHRYNLHWKGYVIYHLYKKKTIINIKILLKFY